MSSAAERHQASHEVDDICCEIAKLLTRLIDPAYCIGAGHHLQPLMDRLKSLHDDAVAEHSRTLREMQN